MISRHEQGSAPSAGSQPRWQQIVTFIGVVLVIAAMMALLSYFESLTDDDSSGEPQVAVTTTVSTADSAFVQDARDLDFFAQADGHAIENFGEQVCGYLRDGRARTDVATALYEQNSIDEAEAITFVVLAIHHLCPEFE